MSWGDAKGVIVFDRGVNKEAVYLSEAPTTVDLGNGHPCLNYPSSCVNGSSISLWLKYTFKSHALQSLDGTLMSIGSLEDENEGLQMFHVNQTFEHLALSFRADNKKCVFVFDAPESVWVHVTMTWRPASGIVVYLNGKEVVDFLESWCVPKELKVSLLSTIMSVSG